MKRLARVMVIPLMVLSLAACGNDDAGSSGEASGSDTQVLSLDAMKYLPSGRVIQYEEQLKEAEKKGREAVDSVLYLAAAENGMIGQTLTVNNEIFNQPIKGSTLTFKEDGTIAADKALMDALGNPTHWQLGISTLRVCWEPSCEYYASWSVRPDLSSADSMRYNMYLEGLTDSEWSQTLELTGERRPPFEDAVVPFEEYEPPVYEDERWAG